jgi:hypothetical protein
MKNKNLITSKDDVVYALMCLVGDEQKVFGVLCGWESTLKISLTADGYAYEYNDSNERSKNGIVTSRSYDTIKEALLAFVQDYKQ